MTKNEQITLIALQICSAAAVALIGHVANRIVNR